MLNLTLKNFRRFADEQTIEFQPGLTIVSGPNGAGKSTLIEALTYALFGPKRGQAKGIRSDTGSSVESVSCQLLIDGKEVQIDRRGDRVELRVAGALTVQGVERSKQKAGEELRKLLGGMGRDEFENTYIALQGDTVGLVGEDAPKRREIIERILQLGILKQAVVLQQQKRDDSWGEVKVANGLLQDALSLEQTSRQVWQQANDATKNRLTHLYDYQARVREGVRQQERTLQDEERALVEEEGHVQQLEQAYQTKDNERKEVKETVDEYDRVQRDYQTLTAQIQAKCALIEDIGQRLKEIEASIATALACQAAAQRYEIVQADIRRLNQQLLRLELIEERTRTRQAAHAALEELDKQLTSLDHAEEAYQAAVQQSKAFETAWKTVKDSDPTSAEKERLSEKQASLEAAKKQVMEALQTLEGHQGEARCPTCAQTLDHHTAAQRRDHLQHWLDDTYPVQQALLVEEQRARETRHQEWKAKVGEAYDLWQQHQENVVPAALKKSEKHKQLAVRRPELEHRRDEANKLWEELGQDGSRRDTEALTEEKKAREQEMRELDPKVKLFNQLEQLQKTKELEEKKKQDEQAAHDTLVKALEALGYDSEAHTKAKNKLDALQNERDEARDAWQEAKKAFENQTQKLHSQYEALTKLSQHEAAFSERITFYSRQDRLSHLLMDFQGHFFEANSTQVMRRATELAMHAITDQSILGLEFQGQDLYYRDGSNVRQRIERLSGGERALLGLCLRIALAEHSQVISGAGVARFLVLDEVLSSLDDERREAVQRIFNDVLQGRVFEHIIMVTHLDTVKDGWPSNGIEVQKVTSKTSKVVPRSGSGANIYPHDRTED